MRAFSRVARAFSQLAYAFPSRRSSTQAAVCTWEDHGDDAYDGFLAYLASQGVTEDYRVPKEKRKEVREKRKEALRAFKEISRKFDFSGDPANFAYNVWRAHKRAVYESEGIATEETSVDEGDAVMDVKFNGDKNQGATEETSVDEGDAVMDVKFNGGKNQGLYNMEQMGDDDINWDTVEELPQGTYNLPTINEGDIDHNEAQRIVTAERSRLWNPQLERLDAPSLQDRQLIGPPLSLDRCRELCPAQFVTNTLFRPRDPSKQKDPKRKYQPKLSDLQHVGLSRVLLQKFVEKHKTIPNNHQIVVYFVQQVYCEEILGRQVAWENVKANMGVGGGRSHRQERRQESRAHKFPAQSPLYLQKNHELIQSFAIEGAALMTQGYTTQTIQEALRQNIEEKLALQVRCNELEAELKRYKAHFGELPPETSTDDRFTASQLLGQNVNLSDP